MPCKVCGTEAGNPAGVPASASAPTDLPVPDVPAAATTGPAPVLSLIAPEPACARCGYPAVKEEAARFLAEAVALSGRAPVDAVIRRIQSAVKADPDAWLPRVRLARAYERRAEDGQPALLRLALREASEALRIAPGEREVHAARIGIAAKAGGLEALKAEYGARAEEAVMRDALRMIEAVEASAAAPAAVQVGLARPIRFRLMLVGAVIAGLLGIGETAMMIRAGNPDESAGGPFGTDSVLSVAFVTAAVVLGLEAYRSRKPKEKQ
jgi:hypothetical protein